MKSIVKLRKLYGKRIIGFMIITSILLFSAGCKAKDEETQADDITFGAQPEAQMVEAYGVIKSADIRDVSIEFPASVQEVKVKNGQKVTKGDTLMVLNTEDYEAQIKEKQSELKQLKEINKQTKDQEDRIALLEDNLSLLRGKLAGDNFDQNRIVSDVTNGLVYNLDYGKGDIVSTGYRMLSIANLDCIVVSANVDQQFINQVVTGAKVDIIPEYSKSSTYQGKVSFISAKAVQINGETVIPVEITLNTKTEGIILDSDVQVKIYPAN